MVPALPQPGVPNFVPTSKPDELRSIVVRAPVAARREALSRTSSQIVAIDVSALFSIRVELLINGLEVRVLPGSPLNCKDLATSAFPLTFPTVGTFVGTPLKKQALRDRRRTARSVDALLSREVARSRKIASNYHHGD